MQINKNNGGGGAREMAYKVLPLDFCPRCKRGPGMSALDEAAWLSGLPLAVAQSETEMRIRYVHPACRLIWDCSYSPDFDGSLDEPPRGPMQDRFISFREGLESHEANGMSYPAGPAEWLAR